MGLPKATYHRLLNLSISLVCCLTTGCFDVEERIEIFIVNLQSERVTLEAEMMFRDAPVVDGTQVTFAVDSGSFAADEEVPEITLDARGGKAEVTLFQGCNGGPSEVTVSFRTVNQTTPSAALSVNFPPGARLTNRDLGFTCEASNISALDRDLHGQAIEVPCSLDLNNFPVGQAAFKAEAGGFQQTPARVGRCQPPIITYRAVVGQDDPQDVEPLPHRCADSISYDANNRTHNPRDGLVSLLVHLQGAEGYDDDNGNGIWDPGESFDDLPEPFLDSDDSGAWERGEWFLDINENNQWDPGNGRYDGDTRIFRTTHMLWTSAPLVTGRLGSRIQPSASMDRVAAGDGRSLKTYLVDENLNPIASHGRNDQLRLDADGLEMISGAETALQQSMGMSLNDRGEVTLLFAQDACDSPTGRTFVARLEDRRSGTAQCRDEDVTVEAEVSYTPGPSLARKTVHLPTLTGTVQRSFEEICD